MLGDRIVPRPYQTGAASKLFRTLKHVSSDRRVIGIAGESGAGKTEIAFELSRFFSHAGLPVMVFQQDDYFRLPPQSNRERRRADISCVGPGEVNLGLLDAHLDHFKRRPRAPLVKPLVVFYENRITDETIDPASYRLALVEGTYVSTLANVDYRVFIKRSFTDTVGDRKARSRDAVDEFSETILAVEHEIIAPHVNLADIIIDTDFSIRIVNDNLRHGGRH